MPVRATFVCDLCGDEQESASKPHASQLYVAHALPPEDWAQFEVVIPEPIVPEAMEGLGDAAAAMKAGGNIAMRTYGEGLTSFVRAQAQPFHTSGFVCPGCQEGPLWRLVKTRLHEAAYRTPPEPPLQFVPPPSVFEE